jgi:hypothetical protein
MRIKASTAEAASTPASIMRSFAFIALISVTAIAEGEAFRCGTKLVMEGDTSAEVAARCGSPTQVGNTFVTRPSAVTVAVPVATWLYNLGPNKLMVRLHIEGGTVVQIDTLGYGYIDNR